MTPQAALKPAKGGAGRFAANGLVIWTRIAGVTLAKLLSTRFLFLAFGIEGFGTYMAAASIALLTSFLTGAMDTASLRAIAIDRSGPAEKSRLFNALLGMHIWVGLALLLVGSIGGTWVVTNVLVIPEDLRASAQVVFLCILAASVAGTMLSPYEKYLQSEERFAIFAGLEIARNWVLVPVSYAMMFYDGERMMLYAAIAASTAILSNLIGASIALRAYPATRPRPSYFVDRTFYRAHGSVFSWLLVGSIAAVLRNQGVLILVNVIGGPTASAAYAISSQIMGALRQLANAMRVALTPRIYGKEGAGDRAAMLAAALAAGRLSALVVLAFALPLMFQMSSALQIWLGDVDAVVAVVATILVVTVFVDQSSLGANMANLAMGQIGRYQLVTGFISLLIVPLGYVVGTLTGSYLAVLFVSLGITAIVAVARVMLLESRAPGVTGQFFRNTVLKLLIAAVPLVALGLVLNALMPASPLRLGVHMVLNAGVFAASAYWLGLLPNERAAVAALVRRKARRQ